MINRKLASLRTLYDINQIIFANLLGVTRNTYSNKESGKTPFLQKEMIEITNYLKELDPSLTMDEIFNIDEVNQTVTKNMGA